MPDTKIDISAYPDAAFIAIAEIAKLLRTIVEKTPASQHEKNWERYELNMLRLEKFFGLGE